MSASQLSPAPAGLTAKLIPGGPALPVIGLFHEAAFPDDVIRAVVLKDGKLTIAPLSATLASA